MTAHAAASPSSAAMWMSCPASITLAVDRFRPSSRYAKEGTAAHSIAQKILDGDLFPPGKLVVEGDTFITGIAMLKALNGYVGYVQDLEDRGFDVHVEHRIRIPFSDGLVWGTTDCAACNLVTLEVVDLKYGKGVPVDPTSAQLKIYALGARLSLWPKAPIERVKLTVFQPRLDRAPKQIEMPLAELVAWGRTELRPAINRIVDGNETEVAGTWCRWCIRKDECAAFARKKSNMAADAFDDGIDVSKT